MRDEVLGRLRLGELTVSRAGRLGDLLSAVMGHMWRVQTGDLLGRLDLVDQAVRGIEEIADRCGLPLARWHLLRVRAAQAVLEGRFLVARSVIGASRVNCHHAGMAHDIVFFLAPDDKTAAATRRRGPGQAFESVTCRFIEPDSAIAEWDMYFEEPSAEVPQPIEQLLGWSWPEWVTAPLNDGVEVFALPQRLTHALANASSTELEELAVRWTTRLRSEDGDEMTDDDLLAVLQGVARLAANAVRTGGGLYSWSF
ncbi:hypothetical protein [Streptomyces sp. NPDC060027]|uniref:hypothetical protein n=1 Tax=Streptomyces sp. NPDC060027 TaxID=3347040 RepID=UPI003680EBE2